jgi:TRAP-type C4-dicarboxylate transport system substrate-binding protein
MTLRLISIRNAASLAAAFMLCTVTLGSGAYAQKTINVTIGDGYPPRALQVKTLVEFFIPEVDKRLKANGNKYKIRWNQAWGGQIAKVQHVLPGVQKGLLDIGVVTAVFHQDKVPMQQLPYLVPFITGDAVLVSRTMDELAAKFPQMQEAWSKYNQVLMTSFSVIDDYQMFFKEPVKDLAGFAGKKVGGAGINMRYLSGTGSTPVLGTMVNYYNMLKTGVIDGTMLWPEAAVTFKLVEVAPYMLKADIGTATSKALTANADFWKRLPDEVRQVMKDVTVEYRDFTAKRAMDIAAKSLAEFKKRGGKVIEIGKAERARWAKTMPNIAKDWAAGLDKKGQPGTQMVKAYMDAMRAAKQPIMREWDKE